jgi:hypothetical protein
MHDNFGKSGLGGWFGQAPVMIARESVKCREFNGIDIAPRYGH